MASKKIKLPSRLADLPNAQYIDNLVKLIGQDPVSYAVLAAKEWDVLNDDSAGICLDIVNDMADDMSPWDELSKPIDDLLDKVFDPILHRVSTHVIRKANYVTVAAVIALVQGKDVGHMLDLSGEKLEIWAAVGSDQNAKLLIPVVYALEKLSG
jgi:hypothetical protein